MGQTQILFIVLSVIIVGIAVAVGITQFGSNAVQANKNAVLLDCNDIASKAQTWYRSPSTMGGGGSTFAAVTFDVLSLIENPSDGDPLKFTNANGVYTISNRSADGFDLDAKGTETANHYTMSITKDGITGTPTQVTQ
jgi:hypothetical protein